MRKKLSPIVLLTLFMLLAAVGVSAQAGGSLVYGSAQVGTISPTAPLVFYSFPASAGDLIAVDVLSLTPGFDPSVSLLSPAQQQIAANDNNPLTGAQDAHLSRRLDADGVYALLVGGVNNSTGDFVIKLNGQPAGAPLSLPPGTPSVADFTANPQAQVISIAADPSAVTLLELAADPATFAFTARLFGPDGALLASLSGLPGATLSLPPGTGNAILVLAPSSPESLGAVRLASGGASTSGSSLPPAATQVISGPAPTNFCNLSSGGSVNLRSGPGTNYGIVGQLTPGTFLPVVGLSPDRGWYAATYNNQQVWASNSVTVLNGPCSNLPIVQPPAPPAATQPGGSIQATPTATATLNPNVTVTMTPTTGGPTATLNIQPTATPTTSAPIAPPDSDHQVQLDRNNGGSFSQAISYPDGDTSDRIIVSVANFDSVNNFAQFNVTLVCNGTGAEYVRWGENLNTNTQCGGNLTLTLNNESNQRFLNVTLPSGSGPAFVNYTLVFVKVG